MRVFLTVHSLAETDEEIFRQIATPLIEHPLGWPGLSISDASSADSVVTLTPGTVMNELFPEFAEKRLSVCNMDTREIWINEDRWLRNIPDESRLPLSGYRAYVLQHELGHALGRGHVNPVSGPVPVMVQQTLGIGQCTPNPFPTKAERYETVHK
jgi:hypothetical protein